MNDRLDPQSRKELEIYKLEKSAHSISEADLLANAGFYNTAVNRLYYAAYYVASALMLHDSIEATTHKGIKTMLALKYLQTGKLDLQYGRFYQRLFDSRQAGDYEDFVYHDKEVFEELRGCAIKFIDGIKQLL